VQHDAMKFTYTEKMLESGLKRMLVALMEEVKRGGESPEDAAKLILDLLSDGTLVVMPRYLTADIEEAMRKWPYHRSTGNAEELRYKMAIESVHG
jgi:hypothetical protein